MTNEQRLEMYIRKIVQKFVIKAKSGRYSTVMYDRLPESLQEAIAREV